MVFWIHAEPAWVLSDGIPSRVHKTDFVNLGEVSYFRDVLHSEGGGFVQEGPIL